MSSVLTIAYYCSGHGYGHATRVSAFTTHLLTCTDPPPTVHIVSSAPSTVFAECLSRGAIYRYAEIDPVIVQPLAYRVDREASLQVLKKFLQKKDAKLEHERQWLFQIKADCVLTDAAFLGSLAARAAGIPSVLITNFTFDSVYSYLSTSLIDATSTPALSFLPDIPIPEETLKPLVAEIYSGYRCASLLLLLPGNIPIPSFAVNPKLPSPNWVDATSNTFYPEVISSLTEPCDAWSLHPAEYSCHSPRQVISAPLLVRPPSPNIYTPAGRSALLASIGVPSALHQRRILVVSFGGQVFHRPPKSGEGSRTHSRQGSRSQTPNVPNKTFVGVGLGLPLHDIDMNSSTISPAKLATSLNALDTHVEFVAKLQSPRLTTPSHIWIPGAPPVSKPLQTPTSPRSAFFTSIIPPTPTISGENSTYFDANAEGLDEDLHRLLPDESWIAIVCGVSKEQWNNSGDGTDDDLPEGFYVAPSDIYMPDLTAVGDVLLGKLGYGTTAECVDACTPFVYVSRPLFIEEHGLRLLLSQQGVGVELSREDYEQGDWGAKVEKAWLRGKDRKLAKRKHETEMASLGKRVESSREVEGRAMARTLIQWVRDTIT